MKITMKNSILPAAMLSLLMSIGCKDNTPPYDGYTIEGTVKGMETGWVKLVETNVIDREQVKIIDSAEVQNGSFSFKAKTDRTDMVTLQFSDDSEGRFFLENSPIQISADLAKVDRSKRLELEVIGSKSHTLYELQEHRQDSISGQDRYAAIRKFQEDMDKVKASGDKDAMMELRKRGADSSYRALRRKMVAELNTSRIAFTENNPESAVAPYVLGYLWSESKMTKPELKRVYNLFDGEAKETAFFKYYEKTYDEIFNSLGVGGTAPDFTLKTEKGGELTLSAVEGKYIYVDFWASWCVPCRASFPHIKELYSKYKKDGFNVVAVGTSDEEEKWKKAIIEDETPWNHVFDENPHTNGRVSYGPVAKAYSVPFLPTTFLVDENMKIVGRNLKKEDLDAKLKELFGY